MRACIPNEIEDQPIMSNSTFNHENILKRKIMTIIQVSSTNLATSVCAAFQKSGIELVRFRRDDDELSNLLPVFGDLCNFIDKRIKSKKNVLIWEEGAGAACAVAYGAYPDVC